MYHEQYAPELTPEQQCDLILASEDEGERIPTRPIPVVCDPAMWARGNGNTIPSGQDPKKYWAPAGSQARTYQEAFGRGSVLKANTACVTGWSLDELMVKDKTGLPRLLVSETCRNLIRTLPSLPRAKTNPEDVDTHADDHAADTLRYGAMYHAGGGIRRVQTVSAPTRAVPATAKLRTAAF